MNSETTTSSSSLSIQQDIEIDPNENRDTSNLAISEIVPPSPKKPPSEITDGKCFNNVINNMLPITSDGEIILVKQ